MNILIIEDEKPAAEKLERLLKRYDPEVRVVAVLTSVESAAKWFSLKNSQVDLVFMDIRLSDGLCFEIFRKVEVRVPVIFTTAHDEYALEAFRVSAIDYLLKPVSYDDLYRSMEKLTSLRENLADVRNRVRMEELGRLLEHLNKEFKNRFMIKVGEHIRSVRTDEIELIIADGRHVSVLTDQGREYIIDFKMEELPGLLDPEQFFRLNRSFIVNIAAIKDVIVYSNSRLKVILKKEFERELIVSRDRVLSFKQWFGMG